jgi:hypothetical protein
MHDAEPNVLAEKPSAFQAFTKIEEPLAGAFVTTIFEDSNRILWIGLASLDLCQAAMGPTLANSIKGRSDGV